MPEEKKPRDENKIKKLMEACDADPALREQLFRDPLVLAKKHGVEFTAEEVHQFQRIGALAKLVQEFKAGRLDCAGGHPTYPRGPGYHTGYPKHVITYPIDIWWKQEILHHVSYHGLYYPLFNPIFYPIGYVFKVAGGEIEGEIAALRQRRRK